jgi:hypothetical protein
VLEGAECYQTRVQRLLRRRREGFTTFRIQNKKRGAGVHISGGSPLSRFGYWSIRAVMAVEPYVDINIEPVRSSPGRSHTITYTTP